MSRRSSNHDESYKSKKQLKVIRKKENEIKAEILDFYHKNNLNILLTDAMNKAELNDEENPSLFMAEYFLNEAGTNMEEHYRKKDSEDQKAIEKLKKKLAAVTAEHDEMKERRDELSQMLADRALKSCGDDEPVGSPGQGKDMSAFKQVMLPEPESTVLRDHTYSKDEAGAS